MLRDMSPPLGLGKKCPPRIAYKVDLALFLLLLPPPSRLLLVSCCLLSNIFRLLSVSRSLPSGLLLCCSFCLSVLLSPRALGGCGGFTRGPTQHWPSTHGGEGWKRVTQRFRITNRAPAPQWSSLISNNSPTLSDSQNQVFQLSDNIPICVSPNYTQSHKKTSKYTQRHATIICSRGSLKRYRYINTFVWFLYDRLQWKSQISTQTRMVHKWADSQVCSTRIPR